MRPRKKGNGQNYFVKTGYLRFLGAALAAVVVASVFTLIGGKAAAQVSGGLHDLSIGGDTAFQYDTEQVCVFCHTPHGANTAVAGLLWNRNVANLSGFQLYSSGTMDATVNDPGPVSVMCLSCHDGVGAMNVLLNYPADGLPAGGPLAGVSITYNQFGDSPTYGNLNIGDGAGDGSMGSGGSGGNDLRNDHPVGIDYAAATADSEINPFPGAPYQLFNGRVECATCHDVHLTNDSLSRNNFLVTSNVGSAMCLDCHNK